MITNLWRLSFFEWVNIQASSSTCQWSFETCCYVIIFVDLVVFLAFKIASCWNYHLALRKKRPYLEFFWYVFSRIRLNTEIYRDLQISVFSWNAGKYGPEKLRIRTFFGQGSMKWNSADNYIRNYSFDGVSAYFGQVLAGDLDSFSSTGICLFKFGNGNFRKMHEI